MQFCDLTVVTEMAALFLNKSSELNLLMEPKSQIQQCLLIFLYVPSGVQKSGSKCSAFWERPLPEEVTYNEGQSRQVLCYGLPALWDDRMGGWQGLTF